MCCIYFEHFSNFEYILFTPYYIPFKILSLMFEDRFKCTVSHIFPYYYQFWIKTQCWEKSMHFLKFFFFVLLEMPYFTKSTIWRERAYKISLYCFLALVYIDLQMPCIYKFVKDHNVNSHDNEGSDYTKRKAKVYQVNELN